MTNSLQSGSILHLIEPDLGEDDGATNASFIRDVAEKLGLPTNASLDEVRTELTSRGYYEITLLHDQGSNIFFLSQAGVDNRAWLDPYLKG